MCIVTTPTTKSTQPCLTPTSWVGHKNYIAFDQPTQKQAVAELGQTQVKLEVVNDVVVKVRS